MTEGEAQQIIEQKELVKLEARQVVAAVSDESIRSIAGLALERESRTLQVSELDELRERMAEHGIVGKHFPRIVFACVQDIKRERGIHTGVD